MGISYRGERGEVASASTHSSISADVSSRALYSWQCVAGLPGTPCRTQFGGSWCLCLLLPALPPEWRPATYVFYLPSPGMT